MFKEIGSRLKEGTMNLSITSKNELMSVIVSFKGVPGLTEALFTGTPEEIEEQFIERLEQPMIAISKFNFDMSSFQKILEEEMLKKTAKTAEKEKNIKAKDAAVKSQSTLELAPKVEEKIEVQPIVEDLEIDLVIEAPKIKEDETKKVIRFTTKQKEELIQIGVDAILPEDGPEFIVEQIVELKSISQEHAQEYFDNNLKADLDKALEDKGHTNNVDKMKADIGNVPVQQVVVEDPFAVDFEL